MQDETRMISVLGFDASYIRESTVLQISIFLTCHVVSPVSNWFNSFCFHNCWDTAISKLDLEKSQLKIMSEFKGQGHISLPSIQPMPWAYYQIRKFADAHAPGLPGTFCSPLRVSDPYMHHGTYVTHVPWYMPVSPTSGYFWSRRRGKTFPAFPAHAQPTILRIWQEAHSFSFHVNWTSHSWESQCLILKITSQIWRKVIPRKKCFVVKGWVVFTLSCHSHAFGSRTRKGHPMHFSRTILSLY